MSTSKKSTKSVVKSAAKTVAKKVEAVKVAPTTKITFKSPRPNKASGPKTELLALVPRKGSITFAKLRAKAEAAELNTAKVGKWITSMARNGRVELAA